MNTKVSAVSTKRCSMKLGSEVDFTILLNANTIVLPRISGNLPSFSNNEDLISLLPDIHLADSDPLASRPIEMLLGADLYPKIILPQIRQNILGTLLAQNTIFGWILTGPVSNSIVATHETNNIISNMKKVTISKSAHKHK